MNVHITEEWQSVYTLTGKTIGTALDIQSLCSVNVLHQASATQPQSGSMNGAILQPLDWVNTAKHSIDVWFRTSYGNGELFVENA